MRGGIACSWLICESDSGRISGSATVARVREWILRRAIDTPHVALFFADSGKLRS